MRPGSQPHCGSRGPGAAGGPWPVVTVVANMLPGRDVAAAKPLATVRSLDPSTESGFLPQCRRAGPSAALSANARAQGRPPGRG
eukprot:750025-Hanusia_phi.AAC.1